jgi:protein-arginine kinase activator protein McsA
MAKKVCTNCGEEKDEREFSWRWKARGKRQSICKECQRKKSAQWYQEHREEHIERTRKSKAEAIETAREFIWDYLSNSICVDCGEYLPDVLTFDHVRGEKKLEISAMVSQGYSIEAIQDEISKCEVVCANCHMIREQVRRGRRKWE